MANTCFTTYVITGKEENSEAYKKLSEFIWSKEVGDMWLGELAEHYEIDYKWLDISIRGWIVYCSEKDGVLTLEVESAWSPNEELFLEINKKLGGQLSISWKAEESGSDIFWIHDEGGYFPERYFVDCDGWKDCESDYFETAKEVVDYWCKLTGEKRDGKTDKEMLDVIEDWEYENDDMFFVVHEFDVD